MITNSATDKFITPPDYFIINKAIMETANLGTLEYSMQNI